MYIFVFCVLTESKSGLVIRAFYNNTKALGRPKRGPYLSRSCTYKCIALKPSLISEASETGEAARRFSDSESEDVIDVSEELMADEEAAEGFDQ